MKLFEVANKRNAQPSPFDELPPTDRPVRSADPKRRLNYYSGKREVYVDYLDNLWNAIRILDSIASGVQISYHQDLGRSWSGHTFVVRSHLGTYLYVRTTPALPADVLRTISRYTTALRQVAHIEVPYRAAQDQFERDQNIKRMRDAEAKRKRDERKVRAQEYKRQQAKLQRDLARAAKTKPTP